MQDIACHKINIEIYGIKPCKCMYVFMIKKKKHDISWTIIVNYFAIGIMLFLSQNNFVIENYHFGKI